MNQSSLVRWHTWHVLFLDKYSILQWGIIIWYHRLLINLYEGEVLWINVNLMFAFVYQKQQMFIRLIRIIPHRAFMFTRNCHNSAGTVWYLYTLIKYISVFTFTLNYINHTNGFLMEKTRLLDELLIKESEKLKSENQQCDDISIESNSLNVHGYFFFDTASCAAFLALTISTSS